MTRRVLRHEPVMSTHPLRRLFSYARVHRARFITASLYSVLNKLFDILPEVLIGVAVDVVIQGDRSFLARSVLGRFGVTETWHQLLALGALNVLIWAAESLFQYLYQIEWRNLAQDLQHDLRLDAYRHLQRLDLSWFEQQRTGRLLSIVNDDVNQLERFVNGGVNQIIQVFCSSLLVSGVFFALQPGIAVVTLLPVPAILLGAFWFQNRLGPRYAEVREAAGDVSAKVNNNLLGLVTIKSFAAEDFEAARVEKSSLSYKSANARAITVSSAITPVIRMAILVGFTSTLVYGGKLALDGELAVGAYSVLVFLTQRLLWPLTELAEVADMYQRSLAASERVLNLLDTPIPASTEGKLLPPGEVRGELSFERVSFDYGAGPVLSDVELTIPAGQTVAFVGPTGSGKSTLVKLLLRFYAPSSGRLLLDGHPIDEFAPSELRRRIGYVPQDTFLSDGTVAENVAYAEATPNEAAIVEALRQAEALEFVERLPQGVQTQLGERGQRLSGGQKQRLALARALYKNPAVLVLDEATSAVDNETEAAIQRSLERLERRPTLLVIAHRLSTLRNVDRIYVIDQGRVVESGTHQELLERSGTYAGLYRLQIGASE